MISLEQALKEGLPIAGMETPPDFIVSWMVYRIFNKSEFINTIQDLLNKHLKIRDYVNDKIEHLTITYILYPTPWNGVPRKEQTYYSRKQKDYFIDLLYADYEGFCNATKQEALQILATETLRGIKTYLPKVKGFDYQKLYNDVEQLFIENNIILL